jgi:hypothetical protein
LPSSNRRLFKTKKMKSVKSAMFPSLDKYLGFQLFYNGMGSHTLLSVFCQTHIHRYPEVLTRGGFVDQASAIHDNI